MSYERLAGYGDPSVTAGGLPSGGSIIPPGGGSGISTAPGGSGLSTSGTLLTPPPSASWSYAPVVVLAMQTNPTLFTAGAYDIEAWRRFALQMMLKSGVLDPGRSSEAEGAAQALGQAYGWFVAHDVETITHYFMDYWAGIMTDVLHHDIMAIGVYQAAHPVKGPAMSVSYAQLLAALHRTAAPLPPKPAPAAPPPAASNAMLYVAGAAVLGVGGYFFLR